MQVLRRQVGTVWPRNCLKLGVDSNLSKKLYVLQWIENGTLEASSEIYFAGHSITEAKPEYMVSDMARFDDCN